MQKILTKDYLFYALLICEVLLFTWLNSENTLMSGILPYYEDFAKFIQSGFSSDFVFSRGAPTFPMWGYGAVLFLTKSKFWIVFWQQLLTIFTIYKVQELFQFFRASDKARLWFRFLILSIGFPWFIFQSHIWPYSFSANLLVLGGVFLIKGEFKSDIKYYMLSAFCFGLMLNFRSDYFYYMCFLAGVLFIRAGYKKMKFYHVAVWALIGAFMLVPWGLHTKQKTGSILLSSTNAGHVLFISLGQLPNNPWGITPLDGDPLMKSIVQEKLQSSTTLNHDADLILKKEWKNRVRQEPLAFVKKVGFSIYATIVRPFTNGEVYKKFIRDVSVQRALKKELKDNIKNLEIGKLLANFFSKEYIGFLLPVLLNIVSVLSFLVFVFLAVLGVIKLGFTRIFSELPLFFIYSIIAYQITLQTLTYYNPNYHTNTYLYYLVLSAIVLSTTKIFFKPTSVKHV